MDCVSPVSGGGERDGSSQSAKDWHEDRAGVSMQEPASLLYYCLDRGLFIAFVVG